MACRNAQEDFSYEEVCVTDKQVTQSKFQRRHFTEVSLKIKTVNSSTQRTSLEKVILQKMPEVIASSRFLSPGEMGKGRGC